MNTYGMKCEKETDQKMVRTKNGRLVIQSKSSACGIKKPIFVKEQEAKGLLSNWRIKTPWVKFHC